MKKFLSVVLAVAMIVSLASVAMAKTDPAITSDMPNVAFGNDAGLDLVPVSSFEDYTIKVDDGKAYYPIVGLYGPFSFDADDKGLYNTENYGTDIKSSESLIAYRHTIDEIKEIIGVDSLGYLSQESVAQFVPNCKRGFCTACFDGKYPIEADTNTEPPKYLQKKSESKKN